MSVQGDRQMGIGSLPVRPMAHVRIFFKDVAHLLGMARVWRRGRGSGRTPPLALETGGGSLRGRARRGRARRPDHRDRTDWVVYEVVLLWVSIVLLMVVLRRISTASARWLAPYLAWVKFAAVLNRAVVELNAPFGGGWGAGVRGSPSAGSGLRRRSPTCWPVPA